MQHLVLEVKNTFIDVRVPDGGGTADRLRQRARSSPPALRQDSEAAAAGWHPFDGALQAVPGVEAVKPQHVGMLFDADAETTGSSAGGEGSPISTHEATTSSSESESLPRSGHVEVQTKASSAMAEPVLGRNLRSAEQVFGCRPRRMGWKEATDTAGWWKTSLSVCPVTDFPIAMLPYPPFKLRFEVPAARSLDQKELSVTYVDGRSLSLQVIASLDFRVLGRTLTKNDVCALDAHLRKCKLGPLRVEKALELVSAGAKGADELCAMRAKALRDLSALRMIQGSRMRNAVKAERKQKGSMVETGQAFAEHAAPDSMRQPLVRKIQSRKVKPSHANTTLEHAIVEAKRQPPKRHPEIQNTMSPWAHVHDRHQGVRRADMQPLPPPPEAGLFTTASFCHSAAAFYSGNSAGNGR